MSALSQKKIRVILDTDANNEIDDQHAIAYMLFSGDVFDVEGIVSNRTFNGGGVDRHTEEAQRVVDLCGCGDLIRVRSGADKSYDEISDSVFASSFDGSGAVDLIIERAHARDTRPLNVVAIGKLTNVALALKKDPAIASKIRVVWLGSGPFDTSGGYNINNDRACDLVDMEGLRAATVLLADDVISAPPAEKQKRRGTGGLVYAFKVAGAKAETMANLDEVTRVAQKAADACHSIGMALTLCTVPQAGKPTFTLGDDEMEIGMGIHGEPGVSRRKLESAEKIVGEMMDRLLADLPLTAKNRISVMVNSLGATPPEELYISYRHVKKAIEATGATVVQPLVGRYATSMEMAGMTITCQRPRVQLRNTACHGFDGRGQSRQRPDSGFMVRCSRHAQGSDRENGFAG